jgi:tetratricopeptide (TPR) repeat protein
MSAPLNLIDSLFQTACQLHQTGRTNDAFTALCRLTKLREVPPSVFVEAHVLLAEMLLKRQKPMRARKHLKVALQHDPDHARAHRLMGEAQENGRLPDPYTALDHYRRAVELEPNNVDHLCAAGRTAVAQGLGEEGLTQLRQAAKSATDDPELLRRVVDGLLLANQGDEARRLVRVAMFRHSRDLRFRGLWHHLQFQHLRQEQGETLASRQRHDEEEPSLLPFTTTASQLPRRKARMFRQDTAHTLAGPHPVYRLASDRGASAKR